MNKCRVTMTIPQTNVENHFPVSINTWLIPDVDNSWQDFADLESVLISVDDFKQHLDFITQKLLIDEFTEVTCGTNGNSARIHAQRPVYMSQRGLRMYLRHWLNDFDLIEIRREALLKEKSD